MAKCVEYVYLWYFSAGNLDGSSPVLNLSKNTPEDVSDSDENVADGEYDSDNEPTNGNGTFSNSISLNLIFSIVM